MKDLSEEDRWSLWNRGWPFSRGNFLDVNEVFKEMEEMMAREFEELSKRVPEGLQREQTLPDGTKVKTFGPFVYGYSVTVGPDGKPKVKEFGNFKADTHMGKPTIDVKDKREPLADVIDAEGEVRVLVELPGAEKDEIKLSGTDDKLTISVDTPKRKYFKEVKLPAKVETEKAISNYKNGVLDITVPKKTEKEAKSKDLKID